MKIDNIKINDEIVYVDSCGDEYHVSVKSLFINNYGKNDRYMCELYNYTLQSIVHIDFLELSECEILNIDKCENPNLLNIGDVLDKDYLLKFFNKDYLNNNNLFSITSIDRVDGDFTYSTLNLKLTEKMYKTHLKEKKLKQYYENRK